MILPILLILIALVCAGFAGYGTDPGVMGYGHGLEIICFARRAQGPLYAVCVLACVALILMVVSGKRRAWWLIGLAPVLALFAHRFATSPMREFRVADSPRMVGADEGHGVRDEDYVVGVVFAGVPHCYSYGSLFRTPVVVQALAGERGLLVWNPFANLGRAAMVDRDVSARELEVVSMPANATLVYNSRYGEFLNGITLKGVGTRRVSGVGAGVEVETTTFGAWRAGHPGTRVMVVGANPGPMVPLVPRYRVPGGDGSGARSPVVVISTTRPVVLAPGDVSDRPVNFIAGGSGESGEPLVVFRDRETRRVRAFLRTVPTGEELRFAGGVVATGEAGKGGPFMFDTVAGEGWSGWGRPANGEGKWKGMRLTPVVADEGGYWEVVKYWMPEVVVHRVTLEDFAEVKPTAAPVPVVPEPGVRKRRGRR